MQRHDRAATVRRWSDAAAPPGLACQADKLHPGPFFRLQLVQPLKT
ncbi:MAG: hypothetical protein HY866_22940 [Chloroflexi bacterium]|nr:hypothetical protein [Chloroflexota bacterium]